MSELLKEYTTLVGKVAKANYSDVDKDIPRIVELREEIYRRLEAFDWYNQHYHLPDKLKHLEQGVSLKERKL